MKNHIIRFEKYDGTVLEVEAGANRIDGYYIIENLDPELKTRWKNYEVDKNELTHISLSNFHKTEGWKIVEWEEKEVRCEWKRDVKYFDRAYIEKTLKEKAEMIKAAAFNPFEEFAKQYGTVSFKRIEGEDYISVSIMNLTENPALTKGGHDSQPTHNFHVSLGKKYFNKAITITNREYSSAASLKFHEDGNFMVRSQYGIGIDMYERKIHDTKVLFEHFENGVRELGTTFEYANGKYYTPEFCYIPFTNEENNKERYTYISHSESVYGVAKVPLKYDWNFTYGGNGVKQFKKPKKVEVRTIEQLLEDMRSRIPQEFIDKFKYEQEPVSEVL